MPEPFGVIGTGNKLGWDVGVVISYHLGEFPVIQQSGSMFSKARFLLVALFVVGVASASAQTAFPPSPAAGLLSYGAADSGAGYSSSAARIAADMHGNPGAAANAAVILPPATIHRGVRPFSDFALAAKVGTGGVGFDLATPLAQRLNLRGGVSFFSYNTSFLTDGLTINGALKLQNAFGSVDLYPFNNSFRISPGFSFRNDNHLNASLLVPGGQTFSLGESGDFTSDPSDPIHGTGTFVFGSNFAPRLTMGFGNMLPRRGGHFSVPVEFGFQYISQPTVSLSVSGRSCVQAAGLTTPACGPIDQTYVQQEQAEIQADVNPYRFFPIASIGLSYRIGHGAAAVR